MKLIKAYRKFMRKNFPEVQAFFDKMLHQNPKLQKDLNDAIDNAVFPTSGLDNGSYGIEYWCKTPIQEKD